MITQNHEYPGIEVHGASILFTDGKIYHAQNPYKNRDQENLFLVKNIVCLATDQGKRGEDSDDNRFIHKFWFPRENVCYNNAHSIRTKDTPFLFCENSHDASTKKHEQIDSFMHLWCTKIGKCRRTCSLVCRSHNKCINKTLSTCHNLKYHLKAITSRLLKITTSCNP